MGKYVPKHAMKRNKLNKKKLVFTTGLVSASVLSAISPLMATSNTVLADAISTENVQQSSSVDTTENNSQQKEGLKSASNQAATTAKSVQQSSKKPAATVTGYAQQGTLKVNMVDSTGYVYKAGTQVFRTAPNANGGSGNYFMDLVLMAFPGFVQGQGFGQIPAQYVTNGATKAYSVDTEGDGTWVMRDNYVTDAGRGETFKPQGVVDKSKLKAKLDEANGYIAKADQYTADSIENLKVMIGTANSTYNDLNASQKQVDDSVIGLTNAISKLVKIGNADVNKDALASAIKDANDALTNSDKYTDDSVKALNDALSKANSVYNDKNATQEQVDAATKALNDAIAGLTEKPSNPVDVNKDALANAIKDANDALTNSDKYTDDSVKALNDALSKANSVYNDKNATQEQVDAATKALNDAIAGLTEKPSNPVDVNKDDLASAIKDANDALTNSDKYTDDSVKALNDALSKANAVYNDKNATQEQVDAATKALNDAIAGLTEKPSDPTTPEEPTTPGNDNNNNNPGNNGSNSNNNNNNPGNSGNNGSNSNNSNNNGTNNSNSNTDAINGNDSKSNATNNISGRKTLPQTGEANTSLLSILSMITMSVLGWFGFSNKRKNI